ncbi:MAG: carboxypeptidase M32 [Candidatus Marinimicrobia bacterium]|nr:carboxypeptidase M32 [Candidatus Neomarinimicrobiota bacterium]
MQKLKEILSDISKLSATAALLQWDQETYMPEGSGAFRADLLAHLSLSVHRLATGAALREELEHHVDMETGECTDITLGEKEKRSLFLVWKELKKQMALPEDFVEELSRHTSVSQQIWAKAKNNNDFKTFTPYLEKMIDLKKREAEYYGYEDKPYDALLDGFEPGMSTARIAELFGGLKGGLVDLVRRIAAAESIDETPLRQKFDTDKQWEFGMKIAEAIGLDLSRARQDRSAHPFTIGIHPDDVRITTRLNEKALLSGLFSTIHESGHAIYEQGLPKEYFGTPLCAAASYGIHESQSRLWENVVGRSREFWEYALPLLKARFPQLKGVGIEDWYRMINIVKASPIRVEADEVTYSLHIMLRFDIESKIINEGLKVSELPELWNAKVREYLNITPKNDAEGVLQDVHWSFGGFGYFPSYAMGNLYGAKLMEKAEHDIPGFWNKIKKGEFLPLKEWLNEKVHKHGRFYDPEDLIKKISGAPLSAEPFMDYLEKKYSEIYRL